MSKKNEKKLLQAEGIQKDSSDWKLSEPEAKTPPETPKPKNPVSKRQDATD